jgi:hypothetical protein
MTPPAALAYSLTGPSPRPAPPTLAHEEREKLARPTPRPSTRPSPPPALTEPEETRQSFPASPPSAPLARSPRPTPSAPLTSAHRLARPAPTSTLGSNNFTRPPTPLARPPPATLRKITCDGFSRPAPTTPTALC